MSVRGNIVVFVTGAALGAGVQSVSLFRACRFNYLRRVGMRCVAGISICESNRAVQNGLFDRFALERVAVISTIIVFDLYLDVKIIVSG